MSDLKAVYAENNDAWRIIYMPGGTWKMQEFAKLPDGSDRSKNQDWKDHNANMTREDAMILLSRHNLPGIKKAV